ncbi:MAG TPA: hypothetical protein VMH02_12085 [Verrucomicrobiae bacterium]|nr:hypothetical protein [Verrucomicrobiae bacterium]
MQPIDRRTRRLLMRLSLASCSGTLLLIPLASPWSFEADARSEIAVRAADRPSSTPPPASRMPLVARDPFVPDAAVAAAPNPQEEPADAGLSPLPANDGASQQDGATGALVIAVVGGASPHALLRLGGRTRIVGIGDEIDGERVTSIGAEGVQLEGGDAIPAERPR